MVGAVKIVGRSTSTSGPPSRRWRANSRGMTVLALVGLGRTLCRPEILPFPVPRLLVTSIRRAAYRPIGARASPGRSWRPTVRTCIAAWKDAVFLS